MAHHAVVRYFPSYVTVEVYITKEHYHGFKGSTVEDAVMKAQQVIRG